MIYTPSTKHNAIHAVDDYASYLAGSLGVYLMLEIANLVKPPSREQPPNEGQTEPHSQSVLYSDVPL